MAFRLKSLYIKEYKNIKEQPFDFSSNTGYIALIGLNGSGKSNLLEAISLIFDKLINHQSNQIPFEYKINYELDGHTYFIAKEEVQKDGTKCEQNELVYPSSLIACYSGEDNRLWKLSFEKYYMGYFKDAVDNNNFAPLLAYINKYCWKIALISLLCSEKEEVKHFRYSVLHIDDIDNITIQFVSDSTKRAKFSNHQACRWHDTMIQRQQEGGGWINAKTLATTDMNIYGINNPLKNAFAVFQFLYILSMPEKNVPQGQTIDKLITSIQIKINNINFDDLSEGEKKLILIECITKVLGDENALILLDEPDAHTHIAMKKDLLKAISDFNGQTIMTTHSPMFLNKRWDGYEEKNVYYMHEGQVEETDPLQHLAELTDNTINYFEGAFILSSKKILVVEGPYDILYIKHAINKLIDENPNYVKILNQVAFVHAGGANNAVELYRQTLYPYNAHYDKLVFLFDYDQTGYDGWEDVKDKMAEFEDTKPILLFYQNDYSIVHNHRPSDKDENTYMAEDLFHGDAYKVVTNKVHVNNTHKEFRNITWNDVMTSNKRPKSTPEAIKYYIQDNYSSFKKEWLLNFKPVLDKLLEVFELA
ncbi:MAG: AAA family ATPase [Paludibacteraceae bacterium]|nr:AAA family ATPase [Paludibacteraceae bacterium]